MQIDWPVIRQQAIKQGVTMTRVALRDFDHNDQVSSLHLLICMYPDIVNRFQHRALSWEANNLVCCSQLFAFVVF